MGCAVRAALLRDYLDRVRDYTKSVDHLKTLSGIPMADYQAAYKLCERARDLCQKAQRLLQKHTTEHDC